MSFSSLPPELVHQIIESTVPHTFHYKTYHGRQSTLCRLSLVSKHFRSIAQPLLFEIVKFRLLSEAKRFSAARNAGVGGLRELQVATLVISCDDTKDGDEARETIESLEVFATLRNITLANMGNRALQRFLPMTSHHLTSLTLSYCLWEEPSERLFLPSLCSLSVLEIPRQLLVTLVDPQTVPNLGNFAFVNGEGFLEDLRTSKLDQLLPQLNTLNFAASVWLHPQAGSLHSAAPRTLVDFTLAQTKRLDLSTAHLVHVRLEDTFAADDAFNLDSWIILEAHLEKWSTLLRNHPSLSLKSIYLDSSLQVFGSLPTATSEALNALVRVCQERKIDLIFESLPVAFDLEPYLSSEFVRRQKEQRRKEAEGRRV
ncbi:hypothetical protein JCM3765_004030 [Sporobolomyces pararoseus]